jgi:hypothetical protein
MHAGDFYKVRRTHYLVAPVPPDLLDAHFAAAGADEDDEDNGDFEPSLGQTGEDLEGDGLEDEIAGQVCSQEAALGWANEGTQLFLGPTSADEDEHDLGWANTGPQLRLNGGYESDRNCDDEPDDEDTGIEDVPHDDEGAVL